MTATMNLQIAGLDVSREPKLPHDARVPDGTMPRGQKALIVMYLVTLGLLAIPTLVLPTLVGTMFLLR